MVTAEKPLNNIVVSVVILYSNLPDVDYIFKLQKYLAEVFDYYEIVLVFNPFDNNEAFERCVCSVQNLNFIILNDNAPDDVLRQHAFEQAIGDYVILFDPNEATLECIQPLVISTVNGYDFTGLSYGHEDFSLYVALSSLFILGVSKLSGYHLDNTLSYTGCYGRALVNAINERGLGHSYLRLLLASVGFKSTTLQGAERRQRSFSQILKRLAGSLNIIGSVPHRLLLVTAWLSLAACLSNILYLGYVLAVWLFVAHIQPGWTTGALTQSILFGLLFFSIFVFSCIFSAQISKERQDRYSIARNVSRSDFISSFKELNITDKQ